MNFRKIILSLFLLPVLTTQAQRFVKGVIVEGDSVTPMPFVYIINKSNGNGTMSDNDGRFSLNTREDDTLICSYVGYIKLYVPVKNLKTNKAGEVNAQSDYHLNV